MDRSAGGDAGPELIGCLDMQEAADLESLKNSLSGKERPAGGASVYWTVTFHSSCHVHFISPAAMRDWINIWSQMVAVSLSLFLLIGD